jgi:RNA polymerase sigma-70 factor (sigma-E family)
MDMVVPFDPARRDADTSKTSTDTAPGDEPTARDVTNVTSELRQYPMSPGEAVHSSVPVMEVASFELAGGFAGRSAGPVDVAAMFDAEAASLTRLARFYVDDKTAAEDLVQEAFIRFARHHGRLREPDRAAAYLRSIVINLARDHNRRGFVSWRHRPPAQPDAPSAAETAEEHAERESVVEALRALPRRQRDCVTLRYYYDMPVAEIASALGLSVNTVKTHLQRGLDALGATLEADR